MIETKNLTKVFETGRFSFKSLRMEKVRKVAVDNISFTVEEGEIFGFLGPNGAGKTTTIKMLCGVLTPTAGTAIISGLDIRKDPIGAKFQIGFMPEKPGFYNNRKGPDLLSYYGEFFGMTGPQRKARVEELIHLVGLSDAVDTNVGNYSFGMRKRLALAQALMHDPNVLILDEPTGGLDPIATHEFRKLILKMSKQGKTVLLSSHILPEVEQVCKRVGILYQGRLLGVDRIPNLMKRIDSSTTIEVTIWADNITDEQIESLSGLKEVVEIKRYALGIEIKCLNTPNVTALINKRLVDMDVNVRQLTTSQPDLEDIFLKLIKDQDPQKGNGGLTGRTGGKKTGGRARERPKMGRTGSGGQK